MWMCTQFQYSASGMNMKNRNVISLASILLWTVVGMSLASCCKMVDPDPKGSCTTIINPDLFGIEYDDYNFDYCVEFFEKKGRIRCLRVRR